MGMQTICELCVPGPIGLDSEAQHHQDCATFPRPVEPNRTAPVHYLPTPFLRTLTLGVAILASTFAARTASAEATLIVEADSGKVLHAEHATYPWYPASTTKLM